MSEPLNQDYYAAAYSIGRAQGAGAMAQAHTRTALYAMAKYPGVSSGEVMRYFRQGLEDYYNDQKEG